MIMNGLFVIMELKLIIESIVKNVLKFGQRNKFSIGIYCSIILKLLNNMLFIKLLKYEDLMIIGMLLMEVNRLYSICIKKV